MFRVSYFCYTADYSQILYITFHCIVRYIILIYIYFYMCVYMCFSFQVTVDLGKDAEFQCSVTGQPRPVISWAKDGLPVREGSSGRSKVTGNDGSMLRISSIVRDDKGMYQCFAKNDYEMVQATAELRLGGKNSHDTPFFTHCPRVDCRVILKTFMVLCIKHITFENDYGSRDKLN